MKTKSPRRFRAGGFFRPDEGSGLLVADGHLLDDLGKEEEEEADGNEADRTMPISE